MDEALISLPENAILKFLMPSRRHHPQVEPLLASYKICYIKCWLNHFWSPQETIFIAKNFYLLKTLEGLMPLSKSSLLFPFFTLWNSVDFMRIRLLQNTTISFLSLQTNLHFFPFIPHVIPLFSIFFPFPLHKILFIEFKTHFKTLPKTPNPSENSEKIIKIHFFVLRV